MRTHGPAGPTPQTAELFGRIYHELHAVALRCLRGERGAPTLQATALVHEVFLRLAKAPDDWAGSTHLLAVAARAIRRVLINHALARRCLRRGGGHTPEPLPLGGLAAPARDAVELLALGEALERLEQRDPRQGQIVELRFFGGLTTAEIARVLGVSTRTVEGEWSLARAWLRRHMRQEAEP
ncbi:MAG: sigma-70 family RNA polymerase sigma factor [Planctomycetes bacterium]|nr:sigma-70 family RNA polymerase sigma factor [Planctomycetota bacterium]